MKGASKLQYCGIKKEDSPGGIYSCWDSIDKDYLDGRGDECIVKTG